MTLGGRLAQGAAMWGRTWALLVLHAMAGGAGALVAAEDGARTPLQVGEKHRALRIHVLLCCVPACGASDHCCAFCRDCAAVRG